MSELIEKSASDIVRLLKSGELCINDTLDALEKRIALVDGAINALPTLCFDRAREAAQTIDPISILGGIPVAIKDLEAVAGVRSTSGSLVFENYLPEQSDWLVEHIEANGGVVYAKSNTPEFGSGGQTFNQVFGTTRNPHNLNLSAGGSSGGAAAALASGCAWLAQGSDLGGSLRTPASFCGVTSLRPSPGLIATTSSHQPFEVYSQQGPMARSIEDLALFTDAMVGNNSLAGLSKSLQPNSFREAAANPGRPMRIAYSEDLGLAATSMEVRTVFDRAIEQLQRDNIQLEPSHPDLSMADLAFDVPRGLGYALNFGAELEQIRDQIKPENVWNIEYGLGLSNSEIIASMKAQGQIFNHAANFMQDFDLLICPAAMVPPFPVEERYLGYSEGVEFSDYYRWLAIAYAITMTTLPVITIPCGRTETGLPIGIQLIGKPHGERSLFSHASYLESIFAWDASALLK